MTAVRVRLLGGALNGQVLWVEQGIPTLDVNVATGTGHQKKIRYRIEGHIGSFVPSSDTPTEPGATRP